MKTLGECKKGINPCERTSFLTTGVEESGLMVLIVEYYLDGFFVLISLFSLGFN